MELDLDLCYDALSARDSRFDGRFYVGVSTTRIYCRPICPARTPRKPRCDFFRSAAAAERAGYRPCLRCRPELAPGCAPVDVVNRVAAQAIARIDAGALQSGGIESLAAALHVSSRQLRRVVEQAYGVSPVALAQTQRLLLAKQLLTETTRPIAEVAFASGFTSVRRFNALFRTRYGLSPSSLRRTRVAPLDPASVTVQLAYRPPLAWAELAGYLASRGAAGAEALADGRYVRGLRWNGVDGWLAVGPAARGNALAVTLSDVLLPAMTPILARVRRLFDLDANPQVIDAQLASDTLLNDAVRTSPGLRVPGAFDAFELLLRVIVGQQVSVRAATTLYGRFAAAFGDAVATPFAAVVRTPPVASRVAAASVNAIAALGLPGRRAATVRAVAQAFADGTLVIEPGDDAETIRRQLVAMPGIGEWTAQLVTMRALGDPDAFPAGDLGVQRALGVASAGDAERHAERWRPWRAYAVMHLWRRAAGG